MTTIALKMLIGDRGKYAGLVAGVTFTAFLVALSACYLCGIMTRGYALITENPTADVWVMDPAVTSVEPAVNMPDGVLDRVRSVAGVAHAEPLLIASVDARLENGRFQPYQIIGVDDGTLRGAAPLENGAEPRCLRTPDAAIADAGGTEDKLVAPDEQPGLPSHARARVGGPVRPMRAGDALIVNDRAIRIVGVSNAPARFPPRPLLYMTRSNALRVLPTERARTTFVLVSAAAGTDPRELAGRIEAATELRARTAADFERDTVAWFLANSEDVGDIAAMLSVAGCVGFGATGLLLFMFTSDNLKAYAVLAAMGAGRRQLLGMVFAQAVLVGLVGTGLGVGACAVAGWFVTAEGYPFRMMWFTPLVAGATALFACVVSALWSVRPVLKVEPALVFAGR